MENLTKLYDKTGNHIGWVVGRFYNDEFQSWDLRCYDLKEREYSIDANICEERLNLMGLEKISTDKRFYVLVN